MVSQRRDYPLYRLSVVGGEVTSDDVPRPHSRRDLEAEDIGSVLPDVLHLKYRRRPVEECHPTAVSAWSVYGDNAEL